MKKSLLLFLILITFTAAFTVHADTTEDLSSINVICEAPCPYTSQELARARSHFNYVLGIIENQIQTPLPDKLKPVDVHIGFDSDCAVAGPRLVKDLTIRGFNYKTSAGKGAICLNSNAKTILTGYSSFSHEIMHLYIYKMRRPNEKTLSEAVVTAIRNHWLFKKKLPKKRVCDYSRVNSRIEPLCKEFNLEYAAIPLLVARLVEVQETTQLTDDIIRQQLARLQ